MDIKEQLYRALQAHEEGDVGLLSHLVESIDEHINPNRITIRWSVEDVLSVCPKLTEEQAGQVLSSVESNHDCNNGISWDTLQDTATYLGFDSSDEENENDNALPS